MASGWPHFCGYLMLAWCSCTWLVTTARTIYSNPQIISLLVFVAGMLLGRMSRGHPVWPLPCSESGGCPLQPDSKSFAAAKSGLAWLFHLNLEKHQGWGLHRLSGYLVPVQQYPPSQEFFSWCPRWTFQAAICGLLFCHLPLPRSIWQCYFCNPLWSNARLLLEHPVSSTFPDYVQLPQPHLTARERWAPAIQVTLTWTLSGFQHPSEIQGPQTGFGILAAASPVLSETTACSLQAVLCNVTQHATKSLQT